MKRKPIGLIAAAMLVAAVAFPATASAGSPHLKGKNPVKFTDNGLTLTATATYAGLGNFDTTQTLDATANPTATCTNQGGNQAPGQNPAAVDVTGSTAVPAGAIKNGNVTITTVTNPPDQPTAADAGCPSANWTAAITDMAFTSATVTLSQNNQVVLIVNCTFSSPTSNGAVPAGNVTCN